MCIKLLVTLPPFLPSPGLPLKIGGGAVGGDVWILAIVQKKQGLCAIPSPKFRGRRRIG